MARTTVPFTWHDLKAHLRMIASAVNDLLEGRHNEIHYVTMDSGAATTRYPAGTATLPRITPSTVAVLVPLHLSAAALLYGADFIDHITIGVLPVMSVGYITFQHAATGTANQDFAVILFGD